MRLPFLFSFTLIIISFISAEAQSIRPKIKYGNVTAKDFEPKVYAVDSAADAVYLYDIGSSEYREDNSASFDVVYDRHARIHLLNKNSFDLATVEIQLYKNGNYEEKLADLDVATYNIENGKVVVTKIDKGSIFKDKGENYTTVKFTFPNIKEGSIIEYDYKINSPTAYRVKPWYFQGNYPRLWSEYSVSIPEFYDYVHLQQGYVPYVIDTVSISKKTFNISDTRGADAARRGTVSGDVLYHTWAMQNIKALKSEEFTTTLDNHISKIEFQLFALRFPEQPVEPYMQNWMDFAKELMKDEDFCEVLTHENNWLDDDVKKATAGAKDDDEKARKIYAFVKNNYTCNDNYAIYLSQPLKKTYQGKKGNVVDINILLAAMLKNAGFEVHPVLLSTRDYGKPSETYPIMNKFNYVITQAIKDNKKYLLDASDPNLGFNHLSAECYNGAARVVADLPVIIDLSADLLTESKVTTVFMINEEDSVSGSFTTQLGNQESESVRKKLKNTTEESFFKEMQKSYSMDVRLNNTEIDSLKVPEEPVTIKYELKFNPGDDDIFYFSPLLAESYKENPFKAAERTYPVEMNACMNETYILNMEIPKGYKVEEMPKSTRVMLNENEGMFEYIIGVSGDRIQLRCRTVTKKANFEPEDYATLRDFFAYIVKKEAEQIVFKKQ
ncbi:MAG: transglutaminase domain-containing protein [Panacibacter sp.]